MRSSQRPARRQRAGSPAQGARCRSRCSCRANRPHRCAVHHRRDGPRTDRLPQYGALGVIGEHGTLVEFLHAGMEPRIVAKIGAPPKGHGVLGTITKAGKTIRLDDISEHPDSVGFPEHHPEMEAFLGVPVTVAGEVYGNLYLTGKEGGFTDAGRGRRRRSRRDRGVGAANGALQRRLRRVAVIEDRERIARDLHDAIIQDLFAVGPLAAGTEPEDRRSGNPDGDRRHRATTRRRHRRSPPVHLRPPPADVDDPRYPGGTARTCSGTSETPIQPRSGSRSKGNSAP